MLALPILERVGRLVFVASAIFPSLPFFSFPRHFMLFHSPSLSFSSPFHLPLLLSNSRPLIGTSTDMVVLEVGMPTGFSADQSSLNTLIGVQSVKRAEISDDDGSVAIYFDNVVIAEKRCIVFSATKDIAVSNLQPAGKKLFFSTFCSLLFFSSRCSSSSVSSLFSLPLFLSSVLSSSFSSLFLFFLLLPSLFLFLLRFCSVLLRKCTKVGIPLTLLFFYSEQSISLLLSPRTRSVSEACSQWWIEFGCGISDAEEFSRTSHRCDDALPILVTISDVFSIISKVIVFRKL